MIQAVIDGESGHEDYAVADVLKLEETRDLARAGKLHVEDEMWQFGLALPSCRRVSPTDAHDAPAAIAATP